MAENPLFSTTTDNKPKVPVSLFFRGTNIYGLEDLKFDLILSESHDFNSQVTQHPIEDGSVISDHIQNAMRTGGITALISNFSINSGPVEGNNRAQDAYDILVDLWEKREVVSMATVLDFYENVVITSMPIARDAGTGEALVVQINFQQIKIVKLQEVAFEAAINPKNMTTAQGQRVSKNLNAGRTTAQPYTGGGITDIGGPG